MSKYQPSPAPAKGTAPQTVERARPVEKAPAAPEETLVPERTQLKENFAQAAVMVNDIVLKKYLHELSSYEVVPMDTSLADLEKLRIFKISEMVYQPKEFATGKFASVFSAVQHLNCGVFVIMDSDGTKTDFYMGIREFSQNRTATSLKNLLESSLKGQFPGIKTENLKEHEIGNLLTKMPSHAVSSVTCIAQNKDEDFKDNETFLQGLEKFAMAMQGRRYTGIILARNIAPDQLEIIRRSYESLYTNLSPFSDQQVSYGKNESRSFSEAFSLTVTKTTQESQSTSVSDQTSEGESRKDSMGMAIKSAGSLALGALSLATAPLTGGASLVAAGALLVGNTALNAYDPATRSTGSSHSETSTRQSGTSESNAHGHTTTDQTSDGTSETLQLTLKNRTIHSILEKIDAHLKRMDDCESSGVWECSSYFLADDQETVEIATGSYKALMMGQQSGLEASAINFWGTSEGAKREAVREYVTNFLHPVLRYPSGLEGCFVTPASMVSSNELAIHMGLPRRSVCGLPVLEHAAFGEEVVRPRMDRGERSFELGKIFSMGRETPAPVRLDIDSLTMHAFVTGTTGSGKSNTVYSMLNELRNNGIRFLVIEPAKGEYKNVFGQLDDVHVYGTNPKKGHLLCLNPFSFPDDIHVLEHLDRLAELFNVCWPMYAAMPAILKSAMERAYEAVGWNLRSSENPRGRIFPSFKTLESKISEVISSSQYSADTRGDYSGALLTRVSSLTNGINGMIFNGVELEPSKLFDSSAIVDLSRVGSSETKALIMGVLIMKLLEYRQTSGRSNSKLQHVTVLEEAHNILRNAAVQQNSEAGLLAKSVEMLANAIAEMRTYGEGFIIADQSPGLLDASVIRNTNTKVILRLPDKEDRIQVGCAAGLNDEQIGELAKLQRGVAAIYQSDWAEPVLVQVKKCSAKERSYELPDGRDMLIRFLLGTEERKAAFSLENLESKKLALEDTEKERAALITDILGIRESVEDLLAKAESYASLDEGLLHLAHQASPTSSEKICRSLALCFMVDTCLNRERDQETRLKLYDRYLKHLAQEGSHDKNS